MNNLQSIPTLAPHVRLKHDLVRAKPVLLYPEGIMELNTTAEAILKRCDGTCTVGAIVGELSAEFQHPKDDLAADVLALLGQLSRRRLLNLSQ
jgi:pyrroloquinoline quinone biosynthesis protein D